MNPNTLQESDLHAYVDGVLPETAREGVERFLADHPEDAARVRDFRAQKAALLALFDPTLD